MTGTPGRTPPAERDGMRWSMPLVEVAGITIRLHVTFVLLLALVAASAASEGASAVAEVGWVVALFACVVIHELAHALVARSKGVEVHEIDLLPIGGVSRLGHIPEDWREEAAIAAAGPAASVAVGLLALVAAAARHHPVLPPTLVAGPILVRLGWVNLMLAGFNLLPAFPMDGGRVLRALLERSRPRVLATHQAAAVSRLLAAGMIVVGLGANVWLVAIGIFVLLAGGAEEAAVLVHAALGPAPARVVAIASPVVLTAGSSCADARPVVQANAQGAYAVVDPGGRIVGAVTPTAVQEATAGATVADVASPSVVDADTSLEAVADLVGAGPVAVDLGAGSAGVITREVLEEAFRRRLEQIQP